MKPPEEHRRTAWRKQRVARYRSGHVAEAIAAMMLLCKGYRILERRHRSALGEIDLIGVRGKRLAFVEVKFRRTFEAAEASITTSQERRVIDAAESWVAKRQRYHDHEMGMDVIMICPWRLPRHHVNIMHDL